MNTERVDVSPFEAPLDQLERTLIDEYVRGRGFDPQNLADLSEQARHELLTEASVYASAKLTEVESRSRFFHGIHAGAEDYRRRGPGSA